MILIIVFSMCFPNFQKFTLSDNTIEAFIFFYRMLNFGGSELFMDWFEWNFQ